MEVACFCELNQAQAIYVFFNLQFYAERSYDFRLGTLFWLEFIYLWTPVDLFEDSFAQINSSEVVWRSISRLSCCSVFKSAYSPICQYCRHIGKPYAKLEMLSMKSMIEQVILYWMIQPFNTCCVHTLQASLYRSWMESRSIFIPEHSKIGTIQRR